MFHEDCLREWQKVIWQVALVYQFSEVIPLEQNKLKGKKRCNIPDKRNCLVIEHVGYKFPSVVLMFLLCL